MVNRYFSILISSIFKNCAMFFFALKKRENCALSVEWDIWRDSIEKFTMYKQLNCVPLPFHSSSTLIIKKFDLLFVSQKYTCKHIPFIRLGIYYVFSLQVHVCIFYNSRKNHGLLSRNVIRAVNRSRFYKMLHRYIMEKGREYLWFNLKYGIFLFVWF